MAIIYSPKIITNGLILCWDAGNSRSYLGSGTAWTDLSQTGNNGTLVNGPTFSGTNAGNIVFNGSNNYVDVTISNLSNIATIEIWANIGSTNNKVLFGFASRYTVFAGSGALGYNTGNSDLCGISAATVTSLGLVNNWKHYVFEMQTVSPYNNNKMYINGVNQTLSQQFGGELGANRNFAGGVARLGNWPIDATLCIPMNCSMCKVYNRALSNTEIFQNFNSTRSRFGL